MKKLNSKEILMRIENDGDRKKVSLYLSGSLYEKFKKACGKAPASRVMEELMKEFIENLK
jgi:hypothetical protein